MIALAELSLADLRALVDELIRYNQDQGIEGSVDRNARLRVVRAELQRRVLEVVA